MTEYERGVASFKENLPAKSSRDSYPNFLWIKPPYHDNFENNSERFKFNKALDDACKFHKNVHALELKKVWDSKNSKLYSTSHTKFTSEGLYKYWEAVDRTVRYCDSILLKKREKTAKKLSNTTGQNAHAAPDRYKWHNPKIRADVEKFNRRRLPSPPQRRN